MSSRTHPLITLILALVSSSAWAQIDAWPTPQQMPGSDKDGWTVSLIPVPKRYTDALCITSRKLSVTLNYRHAWNISAVHFGSRMVNTPTGATGSVFHWDKKAIGTGHQGEDVQDLILTLDGKNIDLIKAGQRTDAITAVHTGTVARITVRSTIGPMAHELLLDFPAGADYYLCTQRFQAKEDMPSDRFTNYRYTFMQMMPLDFTHWLAIRPDASTDLQQAPAPDPAKPNKQIVKEQGVLKAMAFYAPDWQTGIAYIYPEPYPGSNHVNHRQGKDVKFRGAHFADEYKAGDKAEFRLKVQPFLAPADQWQAQAQALAAAPFQ